MIIPVGAILAGLAAGSGYAVATRPQGVKMTAEMCIAIVILQLACYATARYLDYRAVDPVYEDGTPVGSLAYFDFVTRSFHWESEYGDKPGEALGAWGYGVRLLEITGFTFGGLIGALIVRKMAYCERCQRYMKTRRLPDSQPRCRPGRSKKNDADALQAHRGEQQAADQKVRQTAQTLAELATRGDHAGFQRLLGEAAASARGAKKLPARIKLEVVSCRQCGNGQLKASRSERGKNRIVGSELGRWDIPPEFVAAILPP